MVGGRVSPYHIGECGGLGGLSVADSNTKRGRGPRALAAVAARVSRPVFGRRGLADGAIIGDWPVIVGEFLGSRTVAERISYPAGKRRDGTLHLRIEHGALATELQHLEPLLLERINAYFGYRAVARVKMVQGPLPSKPAASARETPPDPEAEAQLAQELKQVKDPALKAALEGLGRAVLGREKRG